MPERKAEHLSTMPLQEITAQEELPRRDGGRAAWTMLAAVSLILTMTWG
jgi:hypothetical protein